MLERKDQKTHLEKNLDKERQFNHQLVLSIQNKLELDPIEPIPMDFDGDFYRYERDKKYIPFLGTDDSLANVFREARINSTTQNACIDSISRSLIGKGVVVKNVENPNTDLVKWLKNINNKGQSFSEFLISTMDGYGTFGNQFIEIVRGSIGKKRYIKVYNHSMMFCRLLTPDDPFMEPDKVILSKLLAKRGYASQLGRKPPQIPLWNENSLIPEDVWVRKPKGPANEESTMLHFKNEISSIEYYGLPPSHASLRYQWAEAKAIQFNLDNFENNMILGGMLVFKGSMTHDEALKAAKDIMMSHIGDGKTGRIGVVSSDEGLNQVEYIPYNTQREGSFTEFDKAVMEKIIEAHSWDSVLAGMNRSSTLGNGSQYIRSIWDVKESVLMYPIRMKLIEKVIKPILNIWAEWTGNGDVSGYEYDLKSNMPFSYMADLDPNKFFEVNEAREKAGLKPKDKWNDMMLAEIKAPNQPNQFNDGFTKTDGSNGQGKNA